MSTVNTGRTAFEQWLALGDDGDAAYSLVHAAEMIVELAEGAAAGEWRPTVHERHASGLLLEAIGHGCRCLIAQCWAMAASDEQTEEIVRRAFEIVEESGGTRSMELALREACGELGVSLAEE